MNDREVEAVAQGEVHEPDADGWIDPRTCPHPEVRGGFCRRCGLVPVPAGQDHEAGVTPEMVDAARAAYRDYEPLTLAKYSEAWQFARMRTALVAALSRCSSPERAPLSRDFPDSLPNSPSPERVRELEQHIDKMHERIEVLSAPERNTERLVDALRELRRAADVYQATVRPVVWADTAEARRAHDRGKALQSTLLDAIGVAQQALAEFSAGDTNEEPR